jgi:hypothetical protein
LVLAGPVEPGMFTASGQRPVCPAPAKRCQLPAVLWVLAPMRAAACPSVRGPDAPNRAPPPALTVGPRCTMLRIWLDSAVKFPRWLEATGPRLKKCWPPAEAKPLACSPKLARVGTTGRLPCTMLALRNMLSLTVRRLCAMRPAAKFCAETVVRALRRCSSVISLSRFEPKGRPPAVVKAPLRP